MRIVTLAAAAAALIGSTVMAFAVTDTGTISKIEWSTGTITLDNGNIYVVPPSVQAAFALAVGEKVTVTYEDLIVSKIAKAS
jgi:Protein of unknown function (DUF1344)